MNVPVDQREVTLRLVRPAPAHFAEPQHAQGWVRSRLLFILLILIPNVISITYFGFIASDVYESEAKYVVRSPGSGGGERGAIAQSGGVSRSNDSHAINAFLMSRDAMEQLRSDVGLDAAYRNSQIDLLSRFPRPWENDSLEVMYEYYRSMTSVKFDNSTGISTLSVLAYDPVIARTITERLLKGGEAMANSLTARMREDLVSASRQQVEEGRESARDAMNRITEWRNREKQLDPLSYSTGIIKIMTGLSLELAQLRAQLNDLEQSSPQNPSIPSLKNRVISLDNQIEIERKRLAGDAASLAPKIVVYEQLQLEQQFAQKLYEAAITAQESARVEAQKQLIYVERVADPATPDDPQRTNRIFNIVAIAAASGLIYLLIRAIMTNMARHGALARYFRR